MHADIEGHPHGHLPRHALDRRRGRQSGLHRRTPIVAAAASAARRRRPVSVEQLAGSAGLSVDQVRAGLAALTDTG
ncbi:hypothetical protein [Mycolicibacter sinensis]